MFKKSLVFVVALTLIVGAFSGIYADQPTSNQKYYVYGIATVVGVGTAYAVSNATDNPWAIYGSGIGGFLVTCLVADLIWMAAKPSKASNNEQLNRALKAAEHLQIGSSLDGKTTYVGLNFGL